VNSPWYRDGLDFECQRCRSCCRGEPGFVWVTAWEVAALAAALGATDSDFRRTCCREVAGRISLRERPDGDCVLLGPEGCLAYEARPVQCRTFPFWPEHLGRPADWSRLGRECPGVNQGRRHSLREIRGALRRQKGEG
jgi:Fe-S-cluster containining protein